MGIPGILAFVLLIAAAARRTWLRRRARQTDATAAMLSAACVALVAGLFIKNMTDDFFVRDQGYLFWMLMAGAATALDPLRRTRHAPNTVAVVQAR
jgi:O-antigen ligase